MLQQKEYYFLSLARYIRLCVWQRLGKIFGAWAGLLIAHAGPQISSPLFAELHTDDATKKIQIKLAVLLGDSILYILFLFRIAGGTKARNGSGQD